MSYKPFAFGHSSRRGLALGLTVLAATLLGSARSQAANGTVSLSYDPTGNMISVTHVPPIVQLTVVKGGTGSGTVGSGGSYAPWAAVALTATADTGSTFTGWGPAPCAAGFAMPPQDLTCTATFTLNNYTLTVNKSGAGSGTVGGGGTFPYNTQVTPTGRAAAGSILTGWTPGSCGGAFALTANTTCTAAFARSFALTVAKSPAGGGAVRGTGIDCDIDCTENYADGTSVGLTPDPATGYVFANWSGACSGTGACTLAMTAARRVTAVFRLKTYAIAAVGDPAAGGAVTCTPNPVAHGAGSTCTAAPTAGYAFTGFSGACGGASCKLTNVTAAQGVTATFAALTLRIGDATRLEGQTGLSPLTFPVTLEPASPRTVTVRYATANDTAAAGSDYQAASGTLTFSAGATLRTVSVNLIGDTVRELDETFFVNLSVAGGAALGDNQGQGTVRNDD